MMKFILSSFLIFSTVFHQSKVYADSSISTETDEDIILGSDLSIVQRLWKRAEPTFSLYFDSNGGRLVDSMPSDENIGWKDINPVADSWTNGVFQFHNCSGALIKTWDNEGAPPANAPAYGVSSGFCFRPLIESINQTLIFNHTEDIEVKFNNYASYFGSKIVKAKVADIPLIALREYSLAIIKLNVSAAELYAQKLNFYAPVPVEKRPNPIVIKTVTYRTDLLTGFLKISQGPWRGRTTSNWDIYNLRVPALLRRFYFNFFGFAADTNFHAIGSPSFDAEDNSLLYLADEIKQRGIGGTRVDWIRSCFKNNTLAFEAGDCLTEWKLRMKQIHNVTLPGYQKAVEYDAQLRAMAATTTISSSSLPTPTLATSPRVYENATDNVLNKNNTTNNGTATKRDANSTDSIIGGSGNMASPKSSSMTVLNYSFLLYFVSFTLFILTH